MNGTNPVSRGITAVGLLCLMSGPASAVRKTFAVADEATIVAATGESRVLVRFSPIDELREEWIGSATMHIPITGTIASDFDVRVDVPRTAWTKSATWTSPWVKAGGDPYDDQSIVTTVRSGRGTGTVSVDVTYLVRSIQSGEVPDNGFLIWPADTRRTGFGATEAALFGSLGKATLEISYRKMSEHYKVGAREVLARKRAVVSPD